jgi:hypothetical protein
MKAVTQQGGFQHQKVSVGFGVVPEESNVLPVLVDIAGANPETTFTFDFLREEQDLKIPTIQTIYIDASAQANPVTLTWQIAGQNFAIAVKGHTQGTYPCPIPSGASPKFTLTATANDGACKLWFFAALLPFSNWATQ